MLIIHSSKVVAEGQRGIYMYQYLVARQMNNWNFPSFPIVFEESSTLFTRLQYEDMMYTCSCVSAKLQFDSNSSSWRTLSKYASTLTVNTWRHIRHAWKHNDGGRKVKEEKLTKVVPQVNLLKKAWRFKPIQEYLLQAVNYSHFATQQHC